MEDIEIYQLAGEVLGTITHELSDGIYAKLGGELSINWRGREGAKNLFPAPVNRQATEARHHGVLRVCATGVA